MRVGIIGLGNIGGGLARVLADHHDLMLYDHNVERAGCSERACQGRVAMSLDELSQGVDIIIVAVKPKDLPRLAKELKTSKGQLVVSVAAGVQGAQVRKLFSKAETARLMPNMALAVGHGVMALEDDPSLGKAIRQQLQALLAPTGQVMWLPAHLVEPIGAMSGSGLAFVMVILEALAEAGIALGFSPSLAQQIAAQTVVGAAELVKAGDAALSDLRWQVTSPGGTTIAGLLELEKGGVRAAIGAAVLAAHARAKTLIHDV